MANNRNTHSSPGVYTQFTDIQYAAKTLGITTLGLVGETKKGPAFEPIPITNWTEFTEYFGGTSAELFKGSKYPKYELPYIAKSYLKASDQLYVCRVLGLSGYNAGPAWIITASGDDSVEHVVAVLRSRGKYEKYATIGDKCNSGVTKYDTLTFDCDKITIEPYTNVIMSTQCENNTANATEETDISLSSINLGQFTLVAWKYVATQEGVDQYMNIGRYPISLNSTSKDYIYNVLGSDPTVGSAPIFVEELYDYRLQYLVDNGKVDHIVIPTDKLKDVNDTTLVSGVIKKVEEIAIHAVSDPVSDFVNKPYNALKRSDLNKRFLCDTKGNDTNNYKYYPTNTTTGKLDSQTQLTNMEVGGVYVVKVKNNPNGTKSYVYTDVTEKKINDRVVQYDSVKVGKVSLSMANGNYVDAVKVLSYDKFFYLNSDGVVIPSETFNDYHEEFRCASTPWIVSEIKGDGKAFEVKKLFRFHTISDGNTSNSLVKISIANIKPDEGTFDVLIRDFNDTDASPNIYEYYKNLTMNPNSPNYIGLKIGTLDGSYESVSKYVMAEIIDNDITSTCVPCGFLGYPVRDYSTLNNSGITYMAPTFTYNTTYDEDVKEKKQYFGLSDITGVDVDMLYYKGRNAYTEEYEHGYTNPFHLDSTLNESVLSELGDIVITVDGDMATSAITWETVSPVYSDMYTGAPVITNESNMEGTLYENVSLRKFTVYPFGGFDGWDIYRTSRTNTDDFKATKYKGTIENGNGATFSKVTNTDALSLDSGAITSDYYAYLAGANQFEIPERYVINLFATPGIDYVNNTMLVNDILDMLEEKRGDTFYVVNTPDKPFGATDARDEMYTSMEAADNLEDTGIDTYYAATYYPWVKYFDKDNSIYVNLPPTKDALRNMANVDNKKYPWYSPAGIERGDVECTKMHFFTKLEDEDNVYDGRINPLKTFSEDGVKIWGNKTMCSGDTPMNRINVVRLMLYMRKLIIKASMKLIFEPNDATLKEQFEGIVKPILEQIKQDRGITAYRLKVSQTLEQMDAHEISCSLFVKPTPTLEHVSINFIVTPQGVEFDDIT